MLFIGLLGILTVIGTSSISAARGTEIVDGSASGNGQTVDQAAGQAAGQGISPDSTAQAASGIKVPELYVHVVGEVKTPGLYVLDSGARLVDLIALAGGFTRQADQGSVNLARTLTDGEQVFVLNRAAMGSANAGVSSLNSSTGQISALPGGRISLNRASESELESLPRVGPALAQRIVDWRTANGGFKNLTDLLKVAGFGDKMFAAIKSQVTL